MGIGISFKDINEFKHAVMAYHAILTNSLQMFIKGISAENKKGL